MDQYIRMAGSELARRNGLGFGQLLSLAGSHLSPSNARFRGQLLDLSQRPGALQAFWDQNGLRSAGSAVEDKYQDAVLWHLHAAGALLKYEQAGTGSGSQSALLQEAYAAQANLVKSVLLALNRDESNWMVETVKAITVDLRSTAIRADDDLIAQRRKPVNRDEAGRTLMEAFKACSDRNPLETTKRLGCLHVANQLLKLYFNLNNFQQSINLIKNVKAGGNVLSLDHFPVSHVVTFRFFHGRVLLLEGNYLEAEKELGLALDRCHRNCISHRRLILLYLIPVRLLLGRIPQAALLSKYRLAQFVDIVTAVRQGNIRLLNSALATHQAFFIKRGIYLVLEKLQLLCMRTLFKKVHAILNDAKLPVSAFVTALNWMGIDADMDEAECLLATLISEKRIKGYIAHQRNILVLSKNQPFPPLTL
ncbi:hypothetical protein CAOG_04921 [Capsaspora owczarzaki ATCC 30864]|uniref:PCI domain-containing protein n=1 Tax=Capsaspora owczarzaki (strain ATCC 30864) TaxID=595528 RepID=A0A0D2VSV8_CAPO3|nr:hypothetical protein CAOG_04921 [Capsaspora owczarzaki ATCC 30864]KJE94252.1 hypothetical protein CAOG_004921 [Capsaspora owczarzaki ATCC 30864]|eukprot:XP_004347672.2 hypothetical protein CAOG_04921 [Capsaspora owczarzaki ATCC 30864]